MCTNSLLNKTYFGYVFRHFNKGDRALIFFCYAKEDKEVVDQIYLHLKDAKLNPWMDKPPHPYEHLGIPLGADWDSFIRKKIQEAHYFLAFLSNRSISKRGYVQREYRLALTLMNELPVEERFLIPVLLEECSVPSIRVDSIDLRSLQWYSLPESNVDGLINILSKGVKQRDEDYIVERFTIQLQQASEVQKSFNLQRHPQIPHYEVSAWTNPCYEVNGDHIDIFSCGGNKYVTVVGDVSGKGYAAALITPMLHTCVRLITESEGSLSEKVFRINNYLFGATQVNRFIQFFIGILDTSTHEFTYCSAANEPAYLFSETRQQPVTLRGGGPPAGAFKDAIYHEETILLQPGDTLIVFTDGITEVQNSEDEEFGHARLVKVVNESLDNYLNDVLARIIHSLEVFRGDDSITDDQTILLLRRME